MNVLILLYLLCFMNNLSSKSAAIKKFQREIWNYYAQNRRSFPWREEISIYRVVVSEIMLQQTQAGRVVEKFSAFVERFPSFAALHKAPVNDVLGMWKGLGYNRRALALKKIAAQFAGEHVVFPENPAEIDLLPSIGAATAASIAVFAFNKPHAFIETNIRRVFIHFFFKGASRQIHDKELLPLIEAALDTKRPRDWYYALMDYGAMLVKVVPNPNRKSTHYVRQAPFAGSNRQMRGMVLEVLLKSKAKKVSQAALAKKLANFPDYEKRVGALLEALQKEGFLVLKGKMVHIKD